MNHKAFLSLLTIAAPALTCAAKSSRPNIVFFLIDDNGWVDSQVAYGDEVYPNNKRFNTPNMLRLSQQSAIMTNAYACPLSTPTRTSLMTGMNSAHEKITSYGAINKDTPTDAAGGTLGIINENLSDPFARPDWNWNGLSPISGIDHTLYATPFVKILKDNGYFTVHIGKAHWASVGTPGASPYNMGFIVNVSGQAAGYPRSYQGTDRYGNTDSLWQPNAVMNLTEYYDTKTHLNEALTLEALKAIDYPISTGQPFYLYMSHYATHTPIQPDERFYKKYLDAGMDPKQAMYASMCESVDKSLGDIMDYLQKKGVADNTIIILYSDNGGHSANASKGGIPHTQNAPLREGKASVYEGGIREPLLVSWPKHIYPGVRINTPVMPEDFFPTILQMAQVNKYTTVQERDGYSLVNLLEKGSAMVKKAIDNGQITDQKSANAFQIPASVSGIAPDRAVVFHMPHQWRLEDQDDIDFLSAVRQGDWKFVYRMHKALDIKAGSGLNGAISAGAFELYNLHEDIGEKNNVAAAHPEITERLAKLLSTKLRGWNASMPVVRSQSKQLPLPDKFL